MPKVSFILPAYKRRFLHEAIASILAQTYRDFELVVVDDCSPENLKEVVDGFRDERLTYRRNEENLGGIKGLVAAWTHALAFARGEWCVLASDDDLYAPEYLEEMMSLSGKYPQCSLFHCRVGKIDAEGQLVELGRGRCEYESGLQFAYQVFVRWCDEMAPEFMFRRTALEEIGGFVDFPLAWGSDDATWATLARHGGCVCSPKMLFRFRLSGVNISTKRGTDWGKVQARLKALEWIEAFMRGIKPVGEEEQMIARNLPADFRRAYVEKSVAECAPSLSFRQWWSLLRRADMSYAFRHRLLYDRFPLLLFVRSLLPR